MVDRALLNAERALAQLQRFLSTPIVDDRDQAGVIQAFEFTYEACWKLFQKLGVVEGIVVSTPKKAFGVALKLALIEDEPLWLAMLESRNLTSHVYNQELAHEIFADIRDRFAPALARGIAAVRAKS